VRVVLNLVVAGAFVCLATIVLFTVRRDRLAGIAGVVFISVQVLIPVQNVGAFGPLKYAVLASCAYLVLMVMLRRRSDLRGGPVLLTFVGYFALLLLTTFTNPESSNMSLYQGVLVSGLGAALLFATMNIDERRLALRGIVAIAAAQSAYALVELAAGLPAIWGRSMAASGAIASGGYNQIVDGLVRSQGTLGNPLVLALLLLVALALVITGHGPTSRSAKVAASLLLIAGCFAAGSRSALVIALLFVLFATQRRVWKAVVIGGLGVSILLLVAGVAGFFSSDVFVRFISGSSVTHRAGALDAIPRLLQLQDFGAIAFGNGYFSAYSVFARGLLQAGGFRAVDNQFVLTMVEGGLVGVALLVVLCGTLLLRPSQYRLAAISVIFFFFTFDVLAWPFGIALFGAFIGLAAGHRAKRHESDVPEDGAAAQDTRATATVG
jgi:hypothetical protein